MYTTGSPAAILVTLGSTQFCPFPRPQGSPSHRAQSPDGIPCHLILRVMSSLHPMPPQPYLISPQGIPNVQLDIGMEEEDPESLPTEDGVLRLNAYTMTSFLEQYFGRDEFDKYVATTGWLFHPEKTGSDWSDLPATNLRTWYGSAEARESLVEADAFRLQSLVSQLSNAGFKKLRQWLFDARLQIDQVTIPLEKITENEVLVNVSACGFDKKDETVCTQEPCLPPPPLPCPTPTRSPPSLDAAPSSRRARRPRRSPPDPTQTSEPKLCSGRK